VYLILGKASGWSMDTRLSAVNASFLGETAYKPVGHTVAGVGDINGDGFDDIVIGSQFDSETGTLDGQTYLVLGKTSGWSMDTDLSNVSASFWGETGDESGMCVAGAGDVNGDGYDDLLIGGPYNFDGTWSGKTYLVLGNASGWSMDTDLSDANASFLGEQQWDKSGISVACSGDVNGDGYDDILIGASGNSEGASNAGQTYLIFFKRLDTDIDGVPDHLDAFPIDPAASEDTDGDGFPDVWNEGRNQSDSTTGLRLDAFPEDIAASLDTDGDGFPDKWNPGKQQSDSTTGLRLDAFPEDIAASLDTDGDGFPDEWNPGMSGDDSTSDPPLVLDAFPDDPSEWLDTDGDGHGDNGDVFPEDPLEWADGDGDGHGDNGDAFPGDPLEWIDTDGDGHGDNGDVFPADPREWVDTDTDGHGDNGDAFPEDPLEWDDTDGDGHGDNSDAFPNDPLEWIDTDGDGHGDNGDVFPEDPLEWIDTDGDGQGDNGDVFPEDPLEWIDTDGDTHGDNGDVFAGMGRHGRGWPRGQR
jgi:hypothetical protein